MKNNRLLSSLFSFGIGLSVGLFPVKPGYAYSQQMVPVIRLLGGPTPSTSSWNAFIPVTHERGCSFVPLVQMSAVLGGTLDWHPVSRSVDLMLRGHKTRFFYDSARVSLDGTFYHLERSVMKNDEGFWVPASFFATRAFFRTTKTKISWPPPSHARTATAPAQVTPVSAPVSPTPTSTPVAQEKPDEPTTPAATTAPDDSAKAVSQAVPGRAIHRIVVDPGHGGKDPGTVGPHGTEEKALNLLIAQDLAEALRQEQGYEVLLTRTDDTFIPLAGRTRLANRYNADLFISIHCNASLSSKLKGFEVYFLSETASDPHADAVARLENAPLALEGNAAPSPTQVQSVLRSLMKTANINEGSELGSLVDRSMGEQLSEPRLGVKQAAFYVLRGAEMPAILIETGFLSNPAEAKLLQKESFRKALVDGIVKGIVAYDQRKQKERRP